MGELQSQGGILDVRSPTRRVGRTEFFYVVVLIQAFARVKTLRVSEIDDVVVSHLF